MPFPVPALLDSLKRAENPLSGGGNWAHLPWGVNTTAGHDYAAEGLSLGSARWVVSQFTEPAVAWQAGNNGEVQEHEGKGGTAIKLWACLQGEAHSGYVLVAEETSSGSKKWKVKLEKWEGGVATLLHAFVEVGELSFSTKGQLGLLVTAGKVSAWAGKVGEMTECCNASDATYNKGYSGVEIPYEPNWEEFRSGSNAAGNQLAGSIAATSQFSAGLQARLTGTTTSSAAFKAVFGGSLNVTGMIL